MVISKSGELLESRLVMRSKRFYKVGLEVVLVELSSVILLR